jgi:hypothetical protein
MRGGLVEQQDAGLARQGAGDRDELLLAHRQARAALAEPGVVALFEAADEAVGAGGPGGGLDLRIAESLSSRPIAMFSRALAASRKGSCGTRPTDSRKAASSRLAMGWPSISSRPSLTG